MAFWARGEFWLLTLMGIVNSGIYIKWQEPLYPITLFLILQGVNSYDLAKAISIVFVMVCPYACFNLAWAKRREIKGHRSLKLWLTGSLLGFVGGNGYIIAVLYKEINFYHFRSFVIHDWAILGLHFLLLV